MNSYPVYSRPCYITICHFYYFYYDYSAETPLFSQGTPECRRVRGITSGTIAFCREENRPSCFLGGGSSRESPCGCPGRWEATCSFVPRSSALSLTQLIFTNSLESQVLLSKGFPSPPSLLRPPICVIGSSVLFPLPLLLRPLVTHQKLFKIPCLLRAPLL